MNSSYKFALIGAAALCIIVIVYYLAGNNPVEGDPAVSTSQDDGEGDAPAIVSTESDTQPDTITPSTGGERDRSATHRNERIIPSGGASDPDQRTSSLSRDRATTNLLDSSRPLSERVLGNRRDETMQPTFDTPTSDDRTVDAGPTAGANNVLTLGETTSPTDDTPNDILNTRPTPIPTPDTDDTTRPTHERPTPRELTESRTAEVRPDTTRGASSNALSGVGGSRAITPAAATTYTIEAGDTFSSIAAELSRQYGTRMTYIDVAQANPLIDPNRLKVGQVIKLPPRPAPAAAAADATPRNNTPAVSNDGRPIHTVQASETLSSISGQYYNDPNQWHVIYEANRQVIGPNADRLREGMKLVIPPAPNPAR